MARCSLLSDWVDSVLGSVLDSTWLGTPLEARLGSAQSLRSGSIWLGSVWYSGLGMARCSVRLSSGIEPVQTRLEAQDSA